MWFPKKHHYNLKTFTAMYVDLNVSAASNTRKMSGCTSNTENYCGIQYRCG